VDAGAGWASGAASVLLCQPADTVLTRLQVAKAVPSAGASTLMRNPALTHVTRVLSEGGAKALWRGSVPMVGVVPFQNALLFVGCELRNRQRLVTVFKNSVRVGPLPLLSTHCRDSAARQ
jgi:hypothetical protein